MRKSSFLLVVLLCFSMTGLILSANGSISPTTLTATLCPGESTSETKTVFLPGEIPKADIIIAFDLTGSMWDELDVVKAQAISIMTDLDTLISDAQYGVMSFMDYPHYYEDYYGYTASYGSGPDYAYSLDSAITDDRTYVSDTINALVDGYGDDGPQDYTRIMYESYADPAVGWRTGAKRILLMFGDAVPHDNDLNEGYGGPYYIPGVWTTGGDPGRDEIAMTADDLDLQTVLAEMDANHVTLLYVQATGYDVLDYWVHWTGLTGGGAYPLSDASEIPAAIQTLIEAEAAHVDVLTLIAEAGYETWLTSVVPPEYTDIDIPAEGVTKVFDIIITVPAGTIPGVYSFQIIADADGASYGEQDVTITVPPTGVIPEVPMGTIMASAAMIITLVGYFAIPKFRKKQISINA